MKFKTSFKFPDVLLGVLLTIAVFSAGAVFQGAGNEAPQSKPTAKSHGPQNEKPTPESLWQFATKDAASAFTGLLVLIGIGQAGLFVWQLRYMRRGMKDATVAARAANRGAIAAVAQAKVARDSAIKLQRPYIFVFGVEEFRSDFQRFFVDYTIANYGAIPAIIEDAFIGFVTSPNGELGMPLRVGDDNSLVTSPIFKADETREGLSEPIPDHMDTGGILIEQYPDGSPYKTRTAPVWLAPEGHDVFFRIVVRYRGPLAGDTKLLRLGYAKTQTSCGA